jgi:hypothetical protein
VLIEGTPREQLLQVCAVYLMHYVPSRLATHLHVQDLVSSGYLAPTFCAHRGLSSKTTLAMPPRRANQHLHLDEGLPQTTDQNNSHQPPTQALPNIVETSEHPANMSTVVGSSDNGGGASSTQTLRGAPHQSPLRVPSLPQELDQVLVQDWDEEAEEDEATTEDEELIRVQQEIERLQ